MHIVLCEIGGVLDADAVWMAVLITETREGVQTKSEVPFWLSAVGINEKEQRTQLDKSPIDYGFYLIQHEYFYFLIIL